MIVNHVGEEAFMEGKSHSGTDKRKNQMVVRVKWPEPFGKDEMIKAEIRKILFQVLEECLRENA